MNTIKNRLSNIALTCCMAIGVVACGDASDQDASIGALRLIGNYTIPTKTEFNGVEFGGISGIDRDANGNYWAISDDRGGNGRPPRFYSLAIDVDQTGIKNVDILNMVTLQGPDGKPVSATANTVDPEGIRLAPNGNLYISSEGNFSSSANQLYQPFLREMGTDGTYIRDFSFPKIFNYVDNKTAGVRNNKSFESLTVTPGGAVFVANEDSLVNDGPLTTLEAGSVVRVMRMDAATGKPGAQYAYALPPIPVDRAPDGRFAPDSGLPELLAISETTFIAIERSYADGVGNTIRLTKTKIERDTTDIQKLDSLIGAKYKPMSRELLLEMPITYEGIKMDNFEGISWGPTLANGNRTLILVADNNFNDAQSTLFLAFEVLP